MSKLELDWLFWSLCRPLPTLSRDDDRRETELFFKLEGADRKLCYRIRDVAGTLRGTEP